MSPFQLNRSVVFMRAIDAMAVVMAMAAICINVPSSADASGPPSHLSVNTLLAVSLQAPELISQKRKITYLENAGSTVSCMDDPELRVSLDDFDDMGLTYSLRLNPRGLKAMALEKKAGAAMLASEKAALDAMRHTLLKRQYITVADWLYTAKLIRIHKRLRLVFADMKTIVKKNMNRPDFDPGTLVNVEKTGFGLQADFTRIQDRYEALCTELRIQLETAGQPWPSLLPLVPDMEGIISIQQITEQVSGLNWDIRSDHALLRPLAAKAKTADLLYQMALAEDKGLLSFVEASYDADEKDTFNKAVSLKIGFSIPVGSGSGIRHRQAGLKQIRYREKQKKAADDYNKTVRISRKLLRHRINRFETFKQDRADGFSTAAFNRLLQIEGSDPFTLLKLKKTSLENEMELTKMSHEIYLTYIDLLFAGGKLGEMPLRNFLSAHGETIR